VLPDYVYKVALFAQRSVGGLVDVPGPGAIVEFDLIKGKAGAVNKDHLGGVLCFASTPTKDRIASGANFGEVFSGSQNRCRWNGSGWLFQDPFQVWPFPETGKNWQPQVPI
jgi:hypothetical protein